MKKDQLEHITTKHYKKIYFYLKKVANDFDAETIHQFRVEYKKLRAFLRLLSIAVSSEEIKISNKFKNVYRVAGSIRDIQLVKKSMVEITPDGIKKPTAYLSILQKELKKLRSRFTKLNNKNVIQKSRKKIYTALPKKITTLHYGLFIHTKWESIGSIIRSKKFTDENIHTIRKSLKDLFYNHEIIGTKQNIWREKDEAYVHQLLQQLGNFQDRRVAIGILKTYPAENVDAHTKEMVDQLKTTLVKDKAEQKRTLIAKLKTDLAEPN